MGFSHTKAAGDALKKISALNGGSNSILKNGKVIGFYEVDREERKDGGISGEVHLGSDRSRTYAAGSFVITGHGHVDAFPGIDIKKLNETPVSERELSKAVPF